MSKRILLQNGKILLDNENKVLTTEEGTSALKLIESGTTTYEQKILTLQNPLENNKMYVINLRLADGSFSFILMVNNTGVVTSTLHYYGAWGDYVRLECLDLKTIQAAVSGENDVFGDGTYELYEVQGGGSSTSTSTKLKKQNYIKEIHPKNILIKAFEDSVDVLNETIITFTQAVDIVVEEPRPKRFRKNTTSKPSLYRPIGGLRQFTNHTGLKLRDILYLIGTESTNISINAVYNLAEARGRNTKYIVLQDSNYTLENRRDFTTGMITNINANNRWIISDFERNEKWTSLRLNFVFKPVTNYQVVNTKGNVHYTYLTGTHALEVTIVLTYKPEETLNNNNLKYLIDYKIVELD